MQKPVKIGFLKLYKIYCILLKLLSLLQERHTSSLLRNDGSTQKNKNNLISSIHRIRCYNPLCQNPRKTQSEAPAQTNLASTLATKLPTNVEKHKTNGTSNSSIQYAACHWGYQVGTPFHQCFVKLGPRHLLRA